MKLLSDNRCFFGTNWVQSGLWFIWHNGCTNLQQRAVWIAPSGLMRHSPEQQMLVRKYFLCDLKNTRIESGHNSYKSNNFKTTLNVKESTWIFADFYIVRTTQLKHLQYCYSCGKCDLPVFKIIQAAVSSWSDFQSQVEYRFSSTISSRTFVDYLLFQANRRRVIMKRQWNDLWPANDTPPISLKHHWVPGT